MKKLLSVIILWCCLISVLMGCSTGVQNNVPTAISDDSAALTENTAETAFTIHWNDALQKVDGFGGSAAFRKADGIMRLKEPVRSQLLDMMFSQEKGIGVSILRLIIGDEGGGIADIIEPEKGKYVWDDPEWDKKKADFDKGQIWLANEAKKRGLTTFLSTAWSAPAWMKTNNSYNGTGGGEVKKECYQDYADYLSEYVLGYKKYFDLDIQYISFTNEPDFAPDYPGCMWSAENMSQFIRANLGPTFQARGIKAKIVVPENINFDETMATYILQDPEAAKYIDVVATHAYNIGYSVPEFPVSKEKGKAIWQTEFMTADVKEYQYNTITDGLRYATLMGNMFKTTPLNAYFYWWLIANNGADGSDLIRLCTDEKPDTPTENGLFRVFKRYYTFGNYSRFIRPGYQMIKTDGDTSNQLLVTAYKDPEKGNFSIVAVNNSPDAARITLNLDGFPAGSDSLVPYRTSASENLKKLQPLKVTQNTITVELRGQSVTTYIPVKYALKPLKDMKDVFSTLEAEENDKMTGGLKVAECNEGGKMVTSIQNGSYIKYGNVNFGDGSARGTEDMKSILYMKARVSALQDGIIEIRLDDPKKGKVVGKMEVYKIEGGDEWTTETTLIDTKTGGALGFHDLYLVFKGGKGDLFNINFFGFSDQEDY